MDKTIINILINHAEKNGEKTAYRFIHKNCEKEYTQAKLLEHIMALAFLIKEVCSKGQRVIIMHEPGIDYIISFYACLLSNTIAVPVYPPSNNVLVEKLSSVMQDCQPELILSSRSQYDKLVKICDEYLAISEDKIQYIMFKNRRIKCLLNEHIQMNEKLNIEQFQLPKSNQLAFLQYTSGSTGEPKGVMISHKNIISNQEAIQRGFGFNSTDSFANWLPPYHDMGLIGTIICPLYLGVESTLISPFDFIKKPLRWLELISKYKATVSGGPNFAFELCCKKINPEEEKKIELSHWKTAFCGSEPINLSVLNQFIKKFKILGFDKKAFAPCYGLAEATLMVSCGHCFNYKEPNKRKNIEKVKVNCGPPHLEVLIVDPKSRQVVDNGMMGEIWVRGDSVSSGYWNKEKVNKQVFNAILKGKKKHYLRTGDYGFMYEGNLYPAGRIKETIIINGQNYFPEDIETKIRENITDIKKGNCIVLSTNTNRGEELIVLAQADSAKKKYQLKKLINKIYTDIVANFLINPADIIISTQNFISKTTSGKIERHVIRKKYLNNEIPISLSLKTIKFQQEYSAKESNYSITDNATIERISQCVAKVLETNIALEKTRALAEYGLTSAKLVELSAQLETEFNQPIEPTDLFNNPTIEKIATYISSIDIKKNQAIDNNIRKNKEHIAIIGVACQFPGSSSNVNEFWDTLLTGQNAICMLSEERQALIVDKGDDFWNKSKHALGGYIDDIDCFDEEFFNITASEAKYIDPQQRLALQTAWHAFEDALIPPDTLHDKKVGIFIGASNSDYAKLNFSTSKVGPYIGSGNALSAIAGRLAYFFNFNGPCMTIDTACSSSLVALHQAFNSIKLGECDIALVGGTNLILDSELTQGLASAKMLSPSSQCQTFSANADGYVRSEGIGFVVLKNLSMAQEDNNRIQSVILATEVNQDGLTNGLTAPNGNSQKSLIRNCLRKADLHSNKISYIETHGTGTPLGDPIEVSTLTSIYRENRDYNNPLIVGAVKSNIGHLESAAGMAGLIKVILCLNHHRIPPNLGLDTFNPAINVSSIPIIFPNKPVHWKKDESPLYAGINSFGFTGTNAHVIVSNYKKEDEVVTEDNQAGNLLLISAKSKSSIETLRKRVIHQLNLSNTNLSSLCYVQAVGKSHFPYRAAIYASNKEDMLKNLNELSFEKEMEVKCNHKKIAFIFAGQGCQYVEMGKNLYQSSSSFRESITLCDSILTNHFEYSIIEKLFSGDSKVIKNTKTSQLLLFSIEYSLAQMWISWGINPDCVTGHSLGFYVAACVSGVIKLEDAIELLIERISLIENNVTTGSMAAFMAPAAKITELLYSNQIHDLDIAGINSPSQTIVSGREKSILNLLSIASENNIVCNLIKSSYPFHSRHMQEIIDKFSIKSKEITYNKPEILLIDDLTGTPVNKLNYDYFSNHLLRPVNFIEVAKTLASQQHTHYLELSPKRVLSTFIKFHTKDEVKFITAMDPEKEEWEQTNEALKQLYLDGFNIKWEKVVNKPKITRDSIIYYPFEKKSHWIDIGNGIETKSHESQNSGENNQYSSVKEEFSEHSKNQIKNNSLGNWSNMLQDERNKIINNLILKEIRYVSGISEHTSISSNQNFFELGIDSLMILQLINNINSHLKPVSISITPDKIESPCIDSVSQLINTLYDEQRNNLNGGLT